jgi:hypothetical protein
MIEHFDALQLEMFLLITFSLLVLLYMELMVVNFIQEVRNASDDDEDDSLPLMEK